MVTFKNLCLVTALLVANLYCCFGALCQTSEPCPIAFVTRGCYKDNGGNRVLPNYIYNERDSTISNYGNRKIDWWHWEKYIAEFACRCATRARSLGYDVFGVQFYGECWAGHSNKNDYQSLGRSSKCVGDFYKQCRDDDRHCAGEKWTNFVYEIVDTKCNLQFERVGCYRDNHVSGARPLKDYVLNDRDPTATGSWSGYYIDWINYDVYLPYFACRCAKKAQAKGAKYFGLQFYGECWTSPTASDTYYIDGPSGSCINNCYKNCEGKPGETCIGERYSNYVYRIKSAGEPDCDVTIESIGCYNENTYDRALKTELLSTDPRSEKFYGEMPVEGEWKAFFPSFLCNCAREAKAIGSTYFGVSNGACYSDAASENFNKHGAASATCGEGSINNPCKTNSKLCSGATPESNYIYKIHP